MNRLVIDTDPGVDDAHAILMALAHSGTRVEALTTVSGNVALSQTTANACTILDAAGADVSVYAGASRPLVGHAHHAPYIHGEDGLGDSGYPKSLRRVEAEPAASALVRLANQAPGELALVAIGPLTNVALATLLDPALPQKFKRLVVMGGAIRAVGNVTATAEFNTYSDPEAAAIVFEAWQGLTLVSWETTLAHGFAPAQVAELMALSTGRAEFFRRITQRSLQLTKEFLGREEFYAPDGLAMAAALEPEIILKAENHAVQVELTGQLTRGQTVVDWDDRSGQPATVNLALELDAARVWQLLRAGVL